MTHAVIGAITVIVSEIGHARGGTGVEALGSTVRVQDSADDENTTQKTVIMARLVFRTMIVVHRAKQGPVRTTRILRLVDAAHRQTPQMPGDPRLDMSDERNTTSKLNVHGIGNAGSGIMIVSEG